MRQVQCIGDVNDGGGVITSTPQGKVYIGGRLVAVTGAAGTGHGKNIHSGGAWVCIGTSKIYIEGLPVVLSGDVDTCGHVRLPGQHHVGAA